MIKNEASQEAKTSSVQTVIHDGHVMQRFADGNVAVIGHGSQKVKLSDSQENEKTNKQTKPKQTNKKTALQSLKEMVLSLVIMVAKNLGIPRVVNESSTKEKFLRKKHMGVWRWPSHRVRVIMVKIPVMLNI